MTSFVILHYKNIQDTLDCIKSIKEQKEDYSIIVVDNHTLTKEEKKILKEETEDIICNQENVGFAKGNNIGCSYAIKKYKPDFLVVLNNDIILTQNDFIKKIEKTYQKINFDFMGPKILTNGGDSVNPFPAYKTLDEVKNAIKYHERLIKIYHSKILTLLLNVYLTTKHFFKKPVHLENGKNSQEGIAVHGCCIIFSKKYYEKYSDIFYNETFLYHEEEFLEYRRQKNNLISYYEKSLEVFHKEGASLNLSFQNQNRKKMIFRNQEIVRSLNLLKTIMLEEKEV